jgi:serine/threonine-protein kinase ULK/ATG1
MCKQLSAQEELVTHDEMKGVPLTADKLLYLHAIELCLTAASSEFFGKAEKVSQTFVYIKINQIKFSFFKCIQPYTEAQVLFHSLSQQATTGSDRLILQQYREAVERRLYCLQNQGLVMLKEPAITSNVIS